MKTVLQILRLGRRVIAGPDRWNQGDYALDESGFSVPDDGDRAVSFCSVGVIFHAEKGQHVNNRVRRLLCVNELEKTISLRGTATPNLTRFNDNSTHPMVIALWDETIERLEAAQ